MSGRNSCLSEGSFEQTLLFDAQAAVLETGHQQRVVYGFLFVLDAVVGVQLFLQNILLVAQVGELIDELFNVCLRFAQQITERIGLLGDDSGGHKQTK